MERKKRHTIVLINASPSAFGAEKSLAYLTARIKDPVFQFMLLSPGGECERLFVDAGIKQTICLPFRILRRNIGILAYLRQIAFLCLLSARVLLLFRRTKPDIIHANGIQSVTYALMAAVCLRIPVIWHIRDQNRSRWVSWTCAMLSHVMIVPSHAMAADYLKYARKTVICWNPIDLGGDCQGNHIHSSIPKEDASYVIGLVGQFIPRKGHDVLLRALPPVIAAFPNIRVRFMGFCPEDRDTSYMQLLMKDIERNPELSARVEFVNYTQSITPLYRGVDIIVAPSLYEPFGRVALEAMANGCATIASRVGGLCDIITDGENGLLCEPGSSEDLSGSILRLLRNQDLRERVIARGKSFILDYRLRESESVVGISAIYLKLSKRGIHRGK